MILDDFKLDGQVAIVTGSRRGLGRGLALGLAEAGADIAGFDRSDPTETQQKVEALGHRYLHVRVDLATATPEELQACVQEVVDRLGHVDILVNSAGIIRRQPALEHSEEDWDEVMQVNLNAMFFSPRRGARISPRRAMARSSTSLRCSPSRAASASPPIPPPRAAWRG